MKSGSKTASKFSRDLKASMVEAGLTQRYAAQRLGVTFEHLNRVLNGRRHSRRLLSQVISLTRARDDNATGVLP